MFLTDLIQMLQEALLNHGNRQVITRDSTGALSTNVAITFPADDEVVIAGLEE